MECVWMDSEVRIYGLIFVLIQSLIPSLSWLKEQFYVDSVVIQYFSIWPIYVSLCSCARIMI